MCDVCCCNPVMYGEVLPGWTLAQATTSLPYWKAGDWALCTGESDVQVVWADPCPAIDPGFDLSDDETDALPAAEFQASLDAIEGARAWGSRLTMINGLEMSAALFAACVACGWNRDDHGGVEGWLAQRIARAVQKAES